MEDPEMPPKIMLATTLTSPRPPPMGRTAYRLKSMMRLVMPPRFISSPASMNSGSAISTKLSQPAQVRCGSSTRKSGCSITRYRIEEAPSEKQMGIPRSTSTKKLTMKASNVSDIGNSRHVPHTGGAAAAPEDAPRRKAPTALRAR